MANFSSGLDTASLSVDLLRRSHDEINCDDHYTENYRQEEDGQSPNKKNLKEIRQGERFHLFKSRGQHLLTNLRILDTIIQKAKILPTDTVLEIGPGTGNLTVRLLECAKKVVAVEIDERMVDTLQNRVAELGLDDKLIVITGNALKMEFPHFDLCVANIPYGQEFRLLGSFRKRIHHPSRASTCNLSQPASTRSHDRRMDVSEEKFLAYFWWCWDTLQERATDNMPMPTYFRFPALLAFKIFVEEQKHKISPLGYAPYGLSCRVPTQALLM
ncbi:hypothetical protein HPP92_018127 [Vanilla planifolia]|uniref:rRNA adenine N(6)-methyltransferase n=1 Tax=Vanilla planifolia TaxID=51239 RepID=A0A835QC78_VANPL|nr:hypothetical protein HPP92_018127 [Vanilla planifolia]